MKKPELLLLELQSQEEKIESEIFQITTSEKIDEMKMNFVKLSEELEKKNENLKLINDIPGRKSESIKLLNQRISDLSKKIDELSVKIASAKGVRMVVDKANDALTKESVDEAKGLLIDAKVIEDAQKCDEFVKWLLIKNNLKAILSQETNTLIQEETSGSLSQKAIKLLIENLYFIWSEQAQRVHINELKEMDKYKE